MAETFSVSNAAELSAALASAQGGDRIELAGGDYGDVSIGQDFALDVTIASANADDPAIFGGLNVNNASHLVFDGILFDYASAAGDPANLRIFDVRSSSYITLRNSMFTGDTVFEGEGSGFGLNILSSDHIVIEHNEFSDWNRALGIHESADITVWGNDIHSISGDGIQMSGIVGVLIEDNWIHDFTSPLNHDDMIQLFSLPDSTRSENITIRGNFLDAGTNESVQLIFMRNEVVDQGQGSFANFAYRNLLIEDNVIYGAFVHGITVGETDGLAIRNNSLLHDEHVTSGPDWIPRINLAAGSRNVTNDKNIIFGAGQGTNFGTQDTDPNGANYYGDLFVNPLVAGASLADLRAVSGGTIETLGVGAEMTRSGIDITLTAGPAAMVSR